MFKLKDYQDKQIEDAVLCSPLPNPPPLGEGTKTVLFSSSPQRGEAGRGED
jgi:hypothetical protein